MILLCDTKLRKKQSLVSSSYGNNTRFTDVAVMPFFFFLHDYCGAKNIVLCKIYCVFLWDSGIVFILP